MVRLSRREDSARTGRLSFVAFSCTHCPHQDPVAIDWAVEQVKKRKPDVVVHLGDGIDADAASRWNDESIHDLLDEYQSLDVILARFRKAAPKDATCVYLQGNHCANVMARNRLDPRVRELVNPHRHISEFKKWNTKAEYEYDRKRGCFRIGQVCFSHGYETSASGVRREAIYFLRGHQFGLYVHGHTHRATPGGPAIQLQATANTPLPYWRANAGTLRHLKPDYVRRQNTQLWTQALVVGSALPIKSPRSHRTWEAETIIFRNYDEWRESQ